MGTKRNLRTAKRDRNGNTADKSFFDGKVVDDHLSCHGEEKDFDDGVDVMAAEHF